MTRRGLWCAAVAVAALVGQLLWWDGGIVEAEATAFIPQYMADRSPLAKLFDPHLNDFDAYQARELSYAFDYADAAFHAMVLSTFGVPLFISLSSMLATLLIAMVITLGVRQTMPNVDATTTAAVLAVFLSSFQYASSAGIYYRSSKMLLAATLLGLLFHLRRIGRGRRRGDAAVTGMLCVAAGLLDRQGFFYALVAAVIVGWHVLRTRQLGDVLRAVVVAVILLVAYNLLAAPLLVHALNGYWPDFEYQRRSLRSVALLWQPRYFVRAFTLLAENVTVLLGGSIVAGVAIAAALWSSRRASAAAMQSRGVQYTIVAALAQVAMFGAMIHQHPPIDEYQDHRLWYYALPFAATVMFASLTWLDALLPSLSATGQRIVQVVLATIVIANLAGLPGHRQVMAQGPYFDRVFTQSALIKKSLDAGVPDAALDEGAREFFDAEQRLRARP